MLQGFSSSTRPFYRDDSGGVPSPIACARALEQEDGFVWLDSALHGPGGISILTSQPTALLRGNIGFQWDEVEAALAEGRKQGLGGGLFGWVGFDGEFVLGVYPHALLYDHSEGKWFETGSRSNWPSVEQSFETSISVPSIAFVPQISQAAFEAQVVRAQEYIAAGDIYQVNLSYPWAAAWPEDARVLPLYERLRDISPAPSAACMRLAGTTILSASPELFLKLEGQTIVTHPIKGTRPRFPSDPARDALSAHDLLASEKERAELLMITDLERNDLGQICEFGTVQVPDLWRVESFAQVYHLVSTVTGTLRPDISHPQAFRACFPGGSISGAPKKRALEIIQELETHPRDLYTGAIGYFGFQGHSQWNIAIRSAFQRGDQIRFHVGSGIVADSVPSLEWEETLHKASGLLAAWSHPS